MSRFTPTLTPLDARDCASASAIVAGNALYLTTDSCSDAVLIHDDGNGNVHSTIRGADGVEYADGTGIDAIYVHLRGNADQLDFALTGPAVRPLDLVIDGGWGGAKQVRVELPPVTAAGKITLDLRGDLGQGGVNVWGGADGLSGVNVLDRLSGGTLKVHYPPADQTNAAPLPAAGRSLFPV